VEILILQNQRFNLLNRVNYGRMMLATELAAYLREAMFRQSLAEVHGYLAGYRYVTCVVL
jgi:hypothetical protein